MTYSEAIRLLLNDEQELSKEQRREIGKLLARFDQELGHYKAQYEQIEVIVRGHENHVRWLEQLEQQT